VICLSSATPEPTTTAIWMTMTTSCLQNTLILTSLLQTSCYVSNQHPFVLLIYTVCVLQGGPPTLLHMTFSVYFHSLQNTRTFMSRPSLCLLFNLFTKFQEIWNECYDTGDHPNTVRSNSL